MKKIISRVIITLLVIVGLLSCKKDIVINNEDYIKEDLVFSANVLFKNVNIIPMTGEEVLEEYSILIESGEITQIAKFKEITLPENTLIIDGDNKYITPGFSDMHVHNFIADQDALFLANGVTSIRNMGGVGENFFVLKDLIKSGKILGPEIVFSTSHHVDGKDSIMYQPIEVEDPVEVDAIVKRIKSEGYDGVKVYDKLKPEVYREIMKVAAEIGIKVVGHVPHSITIEEAIELGQYSFEHGQGLAFDDSDRLQEQIELIAESGIWSCNTLIITQNLEKLRTKKKNPEMFTEDGYVPELKYACPFVAKWWKYQKGNDHNHYENLNTLKRLYDSGVNIVSGTDTGTAYVIAGFSIHKEFKLMNEAGLTPYEILLTTTVNPAIMNDIIHRTGTIEVGKDADLVLLNKNPLENIENTKSISGVMTKGRWLSRDIIDSMLAEVEANYNKIWKEY